jgi:hypothetical protein
MFKALSGGTRARARGFSNMVSTLCVDRTDADGVAACQRSLGTRACSDAASTAVKFRRRACQVIYTLLSHSAVDESAGSMRPLRRNSHRSWSISDLTSAPIRGKLTRRQEFTPALKIGG